MCSFNDDFDFSTSEDNVYDEDFEANDFDEDLDDEEDFSWLTDEVLDQLFPKQR